MRGSGNMYSYYTGLLILASIMNLFLAFYAYCHRRERIGARAYIALVVAISFYSMGYAFEITSATIKEIIFWLKVEYIGVSFFPALWLVLVLEYTGNEKFLTRPLIAGLFFIPGITFLLHYTNGMHHLFYKEISMEVRYVFSIAILVKGPWYWVNLVYTYFSFIYGNYLLIHMYRKVSASYKLQVITFIVGSIFPLAGNFIYLAKYSPYGLDLSPFIIALMSPLYAWGLFRFRLFDIIPIARDKVFEGMNEGVMVLDSQNRLLDYNPAAREIFPELSEASIGKTVYQAIQNETFNHQVLSDVIEFEIKLSLKSADVQYFQSRISLVIDKKGHTVGKTIVLNNITEKVILLEKLNKLATIDELTQIYNRRHFMYLCRQEIKSARARNQRLAIIILDLDFFKQINDQYGHAAGDAVLHTIAERSKNILERTSFLGRYGGEEFSVCLKDTAAEGAYVVAEKIRRMIATTKVPFEDRLISVTASFGVAVTEFLSPCEDLDSLLKQADEALYKAKAAGRNCVVLSFPREECTCTPEEKASSQKWP